jgi:hypothetical protein
MRISHRAGRVAGGEPDVSRLRVAVWPARAAEEAGAEQAARLLRACDERDLLEVRKRLYFRPGPAATAILHVRLLGAPWWSYTVAFRDWLRGSPDARRACEAMKERVAAEHAGDGNYDDYTGEGRRSFGNGGTPGAGPRRSAAPGSAHRGMGEPPDWRPGRSGARPPS